MLKLAKIDHHFDVGKLIPITFFIVALLMGIMFVLTRYYTEQRWLGEFFISTPESNKIRSSYTNVSPGPTEKALLYSDKRPVVQKY